MPRITFRRNGGEGIRTPDLLNAIQTRSQLRHGPTLGRLMIPRPLLAATFFALYVVDIVIAFMV